LIDDLHFCLFTDGGAEVFGRYSAGKERHLQF